MIAEKDYGSSSKHRKTICCCVGVDPFLGGLEMAIWFSGPAVGGGGWGNVLYSRGNASHGSFHCSLAGQGCRLSGGQSWRGAGVGSIYSLFPLSVPLYFVSLHLCSTNFPSFLRTVLCSVTATLHDHPALVRLKYHAM